MPIYVYGWSIAYHTIWSSGFGLHPYMVTQLSICYYHIRKPYHVWSNIPNSLTSFIVAHFRKEVSHFYHSFKTFCFNIRMRRVERQRHSFSHFCITYNRQIPIRTEKKLYFQQNIWVSIFSFALITSVLFK